MKRQATNQAVGAGRHGRLQLVKQSGVSVRVVERLARGVERRDSYFRYKDGKRTSRAIELARDPAGGSPVLFKGRAHQCDLAIVHVEQAVPESFGHSFQSAEVDHIERTEREHERDSCIKDGLEAARSARQDAAHDKIGDFGRRDVENALNQAGLDEFFHGLAASAGGVKHQAIEAACFERFPDRGHAGSGDAKHGCRNCGSMVGVDGGFRGNHAADRRSGIAQYPARNIIQPRDVEHTEGIMQMSLIPT